jgi:uncharacterized membrane protein YqjE
MASPDGAPQRARTKTLAKKGETAPAQRAEAASTASLVKDAFGDALSVLEAHLELAVLEVREDARVAVQVATTFGIGAALTFLAAGFVLAAAALGLAVVMPAWLACLIVGSAALAAALVAIVAGYRKYKNHDFRPEHSIEVAQESNPWKAERTS